jgi:hypothetical protein
MNSFALFISLIEYHIPTPSPHLTISRLGVHYTTIDLLGVYTGLLRFYIYASYCILLLSFTLLMNIINYHVTHSSHIT